jgi:hypothetical protein
VPNRLSFSSLLTSCAWVALPPCAPLVPATIAGKNLPSQKIFPPPNRLKRGYK